VEGGDYMQNFSGSTYSVALTDSLKALYIRLINFLPNFVVAVVILIVGWVVAVFVAKLVKQILVSLKLDELGDKLGLDQLSERTGVKLTISGGISWIIKWFFLIAIFLAAADILGLQKVSDFFTQVLIYIPNVVAGAAILLLGTLMANFLARLVKHSVKAAGLGSADMLGSLTQWAIMIFTILATLSQLRVAEGFVQTLFTGIIAMLAIAGGLAFGLGGRDHANKVLNKVEKDIKS